MRIYKHFVIQWLFITGFASILPYSSPDILIVRAGNERHICIFSIRKYLQHFDMKCNNLTILLLGLPSKSLTISDSERNCIWVNKQMRNFNVISALSEELNLYK